MSTAPAVHGVLVVDKPSGPTSHDVVAAVRRRIGVRRIGHTGTLDPLATGVLPLVIGRATRLARFLAATTKRYRAVIALGMATDTYDAQGAPLARTGWTASPGVEPGAPVALHDIDRRLVESVVARFAGPSRQRPPAFSARRVAGTRAYRLARGDTPPTLAPTPVEVRHVRVVSCSPETVELDLEVSPGFYVRSLAHDLGVALGCGAHLLALRRTRSGPFVEDQATPLDEMGERWRDRLLPLRALLPELPAVVVDARGRDLVAHGRRVVAAGRANVEPTGPDVPHRLLDAEGELIALARVAGPDGVLHPFLVLI
jgi:tRNA pseudouridine55 synthase